MQDCINEQMRKKLQTWNINGRYRPLQQRNIADQYIPAENYQTRGQLVQDADDAALARVEGRFENHRLMVQIQQQKAQRQSVLDDLNSHSELNLDTIRLFFEDNDPCINETFKQKLQILNELSVYIKNYVPSKLSVKSDSTEDISSIVDIYRLIEIIKQNCIVSGTIKPLIYILQMLARVDKQSTPLPREIFQGLIEQLKKHSSIAANLQYSSEQLDRKMSSSQPDAALYQEESSLFSQELSHKPDLIVISDRPPN